MKKSIACNAVLASLIFSNMAQAGGSFQGPAINLGIAQQTLDAETSSTAYRRDTRNGAPIVTPYNQSSLSSNSSALDLDVRYGYEFFHNVIFTAGLGFNNGSAKADYSKTNDIPSVKEGNNDPLGVGGIQRPQMNATSSSVNKYQHSWSLYIAPGYRFNFNQSALGSDWLAYVKLGGHRSNYEFTRSGIFSPQPGATYNNPANVVKKEVTGFLWGVGLGKEFSYSNNLFLRHLNIGLEWRRLENNYSTGAYEVFNADAVDGLRNARATVEMKLRPLDMYVFSVGCRF